MGMAAGFKDMKQQVVVVGTGWWTCERKPVTGENITMISSDDADIITAITGKDTNVFLKGIVLEFDEFVRCLLVFALGVALLSVDAVVVFSAPLNGDDSFSS